MSKDDQLRWADKQVLAHLKGYCTAPEHNLPWLTPEIRRELEAGDGGEFGKPGKRARIAALHSSAALAMNFFGYWTTRDPSPLQSALRPESPIERIRFEEKFPTPVGPRAPNLDVVLHLADGSLLAIESTLERPRAALQVEAGLGQLIDEGCCSTDRSEGFGN